jgi:hypothetical protein
MALDAQVNQWRASKLNAGEKLSHVNDSRGGLCPVESRNQYQRGDATWKETPLREKPSACSMTKARYKTRSMSC